MDLRALARRSVEVIREGQSESGAYVASPTFPPYGFCWLRDGSFIADAMSRVGERESAEAFHAWVARVVADRASGTAPLARLGARYTLDGGDDPVEEWPKLQHDGWGLWLWTLRGHAERGGTLEPKVVDAADAVADYVGRVWREPCTDWWEERLGVHAATLACLDAGLEAWGRAGVELSPAEERLDGSLLVFPFLGITAPHLVARVEHELVGPGGGVHRHPEDVYYGGGEWLLLTALLGLTRLREGRRADAEAALEWIAARATPEGWLPEQTQEHLLSPDALGFWVAKWGPPACPLLWSHAMFLTLANELGLDA
jgi:GH15 family glucan-1,4-alpha-glucosidase